VVVSRPAASLEEEEGGEGFAGDVVAAEDGDHVIGQGADFDGVALFEVGDHEVEGGERGFIGIAGGEEGVADGGEEVADSGVVAETGGDAAFDPGEAKVVQRAPVLGGESAEVREESGGFGVAAGLGEIVDEVVADAEEETRGSGGIDEAVGLLEGQDGGVRFPHLNEDEGF
jgi:hypothetical protein